MGLAGGVVKSDRGCRVRYNPIGTGAGRQAPPGPRWDSGGGSAEIGVGVTEAQVPEDAGYIAGGLGDDRLVEVRLGGVQEFVDESGEGLAGREAGVNGDAAPPVGGREGGQGGGPIGSPVWGEGYGVGDRADGRGVGWRSHGASVAQGGGKGNRKLQLPGGRPYGI